MPRLTRSQFQPGFLQRSDEVGKDINYAAPSTFPVTPVLDDFNRSDGAVGGSWTTPLWGGGSPDRGLDIVSGAVVRSATGSASEGSGYYATSYSGPQEVYVTAKDVSATSNNQFLYMCLTNPGTGSPSGYELQLAADAGLIQLSRRDAGNYIFLKNWSTAISLGDVIGMRLFNGSIYVYKNGALVGALADSTYTYGQAGIALDGATASFDNFGGGAVPGVPQPKQVQFPIQLVGNPQTVDFPLCRSMDDFSATSSPLASPWSGPVKTGDGQLQSSLGNAKNLGGGWSSGYRSDVSFADGEVWATKGGNSATDSGSLMYRGSGGGTASPSWYGVVNPAWAATRIHLYKSISGTETSIYNCDIGSPLNNGDAFGARFIGSSHTLYVRRAGENWIQVGSFTDSSITSAGWVGWAESGPGPELQDISWGGLQHDPIPSPAITKTSAIRAGSF